VYFVAYFLTLFLAYVNYYVSESVRNYLYLSNVIINLWHEKQLFVKITSDVMSVTVELTYTVRDLRSSWRKMIVFYVSLKYSPLSRLTFKRCVLPPSSGQ
jgi:hypothetical protein